MKRDLEIEYGSLKRQLATSLSLKRKKVEILADEIALEKEVQEVLEKIGALSSGRMSDVINVGLQAVYQENMKFVRKMGEKNPSVGGYPLSKGHGKGMTELIAVLLRFIAIKKMLGGSMQTLILDESLSGIDSFLAPKVIEFLKALSARFGINILLITQRKDLAQGADLIYQFSKSKGCTVIKQVKGANLIEEESWGKMEGKEVEIL